MKKAKITCEWRSEARNYLYYIKDKRTGVVIATGYYRPENYLKMTTGDVAKELAIKFKDWMAEKGYEV